VLVGLSCWRWVSILLDVLMFVYFIYRLSSEVWCDVMMWLVM